MAKIMRDFRMALGQFEPVKRDRQANLEKIRTLTARAAEAGAHVVCFQEGAISSYELYEGGGKLDPSTGDRGRVTPQWGTFHDWMFEIAEPVPDGPSTRCLIEIARKHKVVLSAGLSELADDNSGVLNCYVLVGPAGFIGKYHKVHLVPGSEHAYCKAGQGFPVFDIGPCRVGVLICYDNHFPEAHRVLALQGAHLILMPHVTTSHPLWKEVSVEEACQQAKHWVLTWMRARAFDNGVYCAFVNQGTNSGDGCLGCSMVVDPHGHVIAESDKHGEDIVIADIAAKTFYDVRRFTHFYMRFRRPELYGPLVDPAYGARWDA